MRRKQGALIPVEVAILEAGLSFLSRGEDEFHGYQLASEIRTRSGETYRTAAGTLYRALDRMEQAGLLQSRWEDPGSSEVGGRPPRRLYRVTGEGEAAFARSVGPTRATFKPGVQPA